MVKGEVPYWDRVRTERLINEMKKMPILWKRGKTNAKAKFTRKDAYIRIAKALKMNASEVEKKIYNIKKKFQRECLKVSRSMSKSTWFAFDSLMFLKNKYSDTIVNVGEERRSSESSDEGNVIPPDLCSVSHNTDTFTVHPFIGMSEEDAKNNLWSRETHNNYNNNVNSNNHNLSVIPNDSRHEKNSSTLMSGDEFLPFSEFVAIKIRNLSNPALISAVQEKILKIIFDAERSQMKELMSSEQNHTNDMQNTMNIDSVCTNGQCSPDSRTFLDGQNGINDGLIKTEITISCEQYDERFNNNKQ